MRAGLLIVAVACGPSNRSVPANLANAARLEISDNQELGWLGVVPVARRGAGDWRPEGPATTVYVPSRPSAIEPDMTFTAIDTRGGTTTVTGVGQPSIPYGCDDGRLDVTALESKDRTKLAPGPVWLLPASAPDSWAPRPVAIKSVQASGARRRYVAGPLTLELARVDARHGTLEIAWNGRVVRTRPFERDEKDGAEPAPIDLAEGGIGVLEPIAAWAIGGERGAILLVLFQQTYEGLHLHAELVQEDRGSAVDEIGFYMYQCAF
jgi:hypothetical protein